MWCQKAAYQMCGNNTDEMAVDVAVAELRWHLANMKMIQGPYRYFRKM